MKINFVRCIYEKDVMKVSKDNVSKYAILGMLGIKSMSGYDMKYWIENGVGYFTSLSFGQIYPALRSFLSEGIVTFKTDREEGRPEKKIYAITEKGRKELERWLREPIDYGSSNHTGILTLKIYLGSNVGKEVIIAHVAEAMNHEKEKLEALIQLQGKMGENGQAAGSDESYIYRRCTLKKGIIMAKAQIEWCSETIEALQKGGE